MTSLSPTEKKSLQASLETLKLLLATSEQAFADTVAERDRLQALLEVLHKEIRSLNGSIAALERRLGIEPEVSVEGDTSKIDTILELIKNSGAKGIKPLAITAGFAKRGINVNRDYIYTGLSRLKKQGKVAEEGGRYYAVTE